MYKGKMSKRMIHPHPAANFIHPYIKRDSLWRKKHYGFPKRSKLKKAWNTWFSSNFCPSQLLLNPTRKDSTERLQSERSLLLNSMNLPPSMTPRSYPDQSIISSQV
jgi:hypothetical protein